MKFEEGFQTIQETPKLVEKIHIMCRGSEPVRLMEICGTHTMAIAKAGIRSLLPESVELLSGPGCPVCVTPAEELDEILKLSGTPGIMIASYGDLLRVPGSHRGDTLLRRRALGASVHTVYSPMDALALARENPEKEVVFLGVGFETTAPGTGACLLEAQAENLRNFSVFCLLKRTEPALRTLIQYPDFSVNGFLCPGHVAVITGAQAFSFLPQEFGLPAVVSGFEPVDILYSVYRLIDMALKKQPALENEYTRLVSEKGNQPAQEILQTVFDFCDTNWRGLGSIADSGLKPKKEFSFWDAAVKFHLSPASAADTNGCQCGSVIRGALKPRECPLFGTVCTPSDPVGPCMVSSEGACAASYRYGV